MLDEVAPEICTGPGLVAPREMTHISELVGVAGKISCLVLEEVVAEAYMVPHSCAGSGMVTDHLLGLRYSRCQSEAEPLESRFLASLCCWRHLGKMAYVH